MKLKLNMTIAAPLAAGPIAAAVDCNIYTSGQVDALFAAVDFAMNEQWHSSVSDGSYE